VGGNTAGALNVGSLNVGKMRQILVSWYSTAEGFSRQICEKTEVFEYQLRKLFASQFYLDSCTGR